MSAETEYQRQAAATEEDRGSGVVAELGRRIVRLRQGRGWPQVELARRLGVSRERLGSWERGRFKPSLDGLLALRRVLGVSIDELLTGEPAPAAGMGRQEKDEVMAYLAAAVRLLTLPGDSGGA